MNDWLRIIYKRVRISHPCNISRSLYATLRYWNDVHYYMYSTVRNYVIHI